MLLGAIVRVDFVQTERISRQLAKAAFFSAWKNPKLDTFQKTEECRDRHPPRRTRLWDSVLRRQQRNHVRSPMNCWQGKHFQERYTELSSGWKVSTHLRMQSIMARGNQWRREIDRCVFMARGSRAEGKLPWTGQPVPASQRSQFPSQELWGVLCLCSITPGSYRAI